MGGQLRRTSGQYHQDPGIGEVVDQVGEAEGGRIGVVEFEHEDDGRRPGQVVEHDRDAFQEPLP